MIKKRIIPHFANPRGALGWVAGRIMATRDSNVERNRWIVDVLDPAPDAQILEIGHGPGLAIESIWPRLQRGSITGADLSPLMSRAAARRNRDGVDAGRVRFQVADSSTLPADLREFDLIFGVNAAMFWSSPYAAVSDLATRLGEGGELVLVYMPPPTADHAASDVAGELTDWFVRAGLVDVREEWMDYDPPAVAVRGRRHGPDAANS